MNIQSGNDPVSNTHRGAALASDAMGAYRQDVRYLFKVGPLSKDLLPNPVSK